MRRMRTLMGVALVALLVAPALGGSFDKVLPENTIAYVTVENVSGLCARWNASPMKALWNEESVQDFLELPRQKLEETMKDMAEDLGARPDELLGMMKGQVAIALTGFRELDEEHHRVQFVLMADVGDNAEKLAAWLGKLEASEKFGDSFARREADHRGTAIVTWEETGDDEEEADEIDVGPPCYFLKDGVFAFGDDPALLRQILDARVAEDARGLADHDLYRTVRRRTGPDADVAFFLNVEQIWALVDKHADEGDKEDVNKIFGALGLMGVKALGGRMTMGETSSTTQMFLYAPEGMNGVMKLLAGPNSALLPPKWVPTDVASAFTMSLDFQGIWAEALKVMDKIEPGTAQMVEMQLAGLKEQAGVDIQGDVIGSLGSSVTMFQLVPEVDEDAPAGPMGMASMNRMVLGIELANTEKFGQALNTLLMMAPLPLETEEYMGVSMRVLDMGMMKMAFAVTAGHLVLATNVDDLKGVIQTQGKEVTTSLVDSDAFKRAMAGLPESRSMVSYSDPRQAMKMLGQMMQSMGPMLLMSNPEIAEWIDMSLFPDGEVLAKYTDVGGAVMRAEEDGVTILGISRMKMPK
jgi:hypothetical protein